MPQPFYTCQGNPQYSPLNRMMGGSHIPVGCLGKDCSKSDHNYIRHPLQSLKKKQLKLSHKVCFLMCLSLGWALVPKLYVLRVLQVSNDGLLGSVTTKDKSVLTILRLLLPKLFDYTVSESTELELNESCQF